ncbi:MAG: arginase family protein, partial [Paracoccaceae bacterium]
WFDSHADLNTPDASTTGFLGGMALSGPLGLWDSGLGAGLRPDQIILVGQRDLDPFEQALIDDRAIPHIRPTDDLATALHRAIAGRAVYMHLDCDVLDPGIVPTDYSCPGGLSLADLNACAAVIAAHPFVGIEIAEFQIAWNAGGEPVSPQPLLGALRPLLNTGIS